LDEPGIVAVWGMENSFCDAEGALGSEAGEDLALQRLWVAEQGTERAALAWPWFRPGRKP
jgi:hypothetical protein